MEERLQKILARAGFGSRRASEEFITAGRVTVNGRLAELGQRADPTVDDIRVDGRRVRASEPSIYIALNKPRGVLSAVSDPSGEYRTVVDLVPVSGHLFPVGRLDLDSEGLVLLTDDGPLANHLTHPRYEHPKEYTVLLEGSPNPDILTTWRRGVEIDGELTAPAEVSVTGQEDGLTWLRVVLREGRNRQIRRMAEMFGFRVRRLIRVRIGPIRLGDLRNGEWRYLSASERKLLEEVGASPNAHRVRPSAPRRPRRDASKAHGPNSTAPAARGPANPRRQAGSRGPQASRLARESAGGDAPPAGRRRARAGGAGTGVRQRGGPPARRWATREEDGVDERPSRRRTPARSGGAASPRREGAARDAGEGERTGRPARRTRSAGPESGPRREDDRGDDVRQEGQRDRPSSSRSSEGPPRRPQRGSPQRDGPQRGSPQRDTPQRDTPRRDRSRAGEPRQHSGPSRSRSRRGSEH